MTFEKGSENGLSSPQVDVLSFLVLDCHLCNMADVSVFGIDAYYKLFFLM